MAAERFLAAGPFLVVERFFAADRFFAAGRFLAVGLFLAALRFFVAVRFAAAFFVDGRCVLAPRFPAAAGVAEYSANAAPCGSPRIATIPPGIGIGGRCTIAPAFTALSNAFCTSGTWM